MIGIGVVRLQATSALLLAAPPCFHGEVCARRQQGHERGDRPDGPYDRRVARCVAEPVMRESQQRYQRRHDDTEDVHADEQPASHGESFSVRSQPPNERSADDPDAY